MLARDGVADVLALEETAIAIAREVLAAGGSLPGAVSPRSRDVVFGVQALLNRHLGDTLTLADISDAVDVSPYHLCRLFRGQTGLPIHRYRNALRLHASLDRIAEDDATVLDIALALGFSSEAHFSDSFRKAFGVRPGAFRRSVRGGAPRRPGRPKR
jgi:AraC-like DNA-binding protein